MDHFQNIPKKRSETRGKNAKTPTNDKFQKRASDDD